MSDETSAAAPGTLPATVTRFVGRRRELGDVRRLLGESRLVTLTGPGGVGKTRLALALAADVRRAFAAGVWFVDLAVITDGSRIAEVVASTLGVADRSPRPAVDKVIEHLRDRNALLVLDNCEHVVADCARFVDRVLRQTTDVRVLATSRHTTGVDGEHLFAVPPLAVPDLRLPQHAAVTSQFDAVRLLTDRVVAIRPGFAVTDENAEAVARLCIRLDGIPLAIELAATRLRSLSVEQVVERLESRFALLTSGSTAAQPRQQTLRALVDWSHSLCSPAQRLLWARLSVFSGSFDLAAAEGVCSDDGTLGAAEVLDVLDHLVAQSIVVGEHDGPAVRFRLLETIRQYGRERLEELGEVEDLTRRHRDHYLAVVEETAARWCGPRQEGDLARLRADHGNLRAALETSVRTADGDPLPALRLVAGLRNHWYADDFLAEGRQWLDAALALPAADDEVRARALWVAAWVCLLQGDEPAATARLDGCEALGARVGDGASVAHARSLRGTAALFAGALDDAAAHFEGAIVTMAADGDTEGLLWTYFQLAITQVHRGRGPDAVAICRDALALCEQHGEQLCRSYTLWVLGFEAWRRGDAAQAEARVAEGLATQRRFNDSVGVALMISTLAWVAASTGDLDLAAVRLAAADVAWRTAGTTIAAFGPPLAGHQAACLDRLRDGGRRPGGFAAGAALAQVVEAVLDGGRAQPPRPGTAGPGTAGPGAPGPGELTSRELAVAELVAEGLSNKAIAAALVISPRTVDGHLERILAKLGFSSRTQVAGWVAARRAAAR
ncbi:LuxR C-terminal-related transcriptional regulator [Kineosporia sp. R_H_3]|uniref:LuxR C-terminal-related transcriptional regulator n=1 Tax=Kineosporia sp. R_H_3 TaxID=1961848 RepID=UPI000B4B5DF9|nr:LuxR C-terminal-related transcriptional regulator [Kineosporia sp. R_H_3]